MSSVLAHAETRIRQLYPDLLQAWNDNDAELFASLFTENTICVGFDGTEYESAREIRSALGEIFKDHRVASYVSKIRHVTRLDDKTLILRAVAGMVPPDSNAVKPERNTIQVLVAVDDAGTLRIASYQNTPAKYDGRPETAAALTQELQAVFDAQRTAG